MLRNYGELMPELILKLLYFISDENDIENKNHEQT